MWKIWKNEMALILDANMKRIYGWSKMVVYHQAIHDVAFKKKKSACITDCFECDLDIG